MYILRYDDDLIKRVYRYERDEAKRNAMLVNSGSSKADASTGASGPGANPFVLDDETVKTLDSSASSEATMNLEDSISEAELNNAENPSISEVVTSFLQLGRMNAQSQSKLSPIGAISSITDAVNNELRSLVSTPAAPTPASDTSDPSKMSRFRREILDLLQFQDKMATSTSAGAKQQQLSRSKLAAYMRSKGFDARMLIMMCDNLVHVSNMEQKADDMKKKYCL